MDPAGTIRLLEICETGAFGARLLPDAKDCVLADVLARRNLLMRAGPSQYRTTTVGIDYLSRLIKRLGPTAS